MSLLSSTLASTVQYTATPVFADTVQAAPRSIPQQIDDATWLALMPQADREAFKLIAYCESRYTQFSPNGSTPLPGINHSADKGIFQLNTDVNHVPYETVEQNIASAILLYNSYGLRPWRSSKTCWQALSTTTLPFVGVDWIQAH